MNIPLKIAPILLAFFAVFGTAAQVKNDPARLQLPKPHGFINDFVSVFTEQEEKSLDSLVKSYEKKTTIEIAVATIDSSFTDADNFEAYTLQMMKTWGVGKKKKNNGILIVIAPELRQVRIENGSGIEKFITDNETKEIIDKFMTPRYKEGKFFEGTRQGIEELIRKLENR